MTTTVYGPLIVVTEQPADVVEVWVRSPEPRPHAGGLMVDSVDRVEVTEGQVSFSCAPGPAILTIVSLVSTGRVSPGQVPETRAVPIMVPDAAAATLADVVTAARVSTLGRSVVEELAARVAMDVAAAREAARVAAGDAQLVQEAATSAMWTGDVLTVLGASSPPLTGPRGPEGPQGERGPKGDPGDGAGDVLWSELRPALDDKAPLGHTHTPGEVDGLDTALAGKADTGHRHTWDQVDRKPATFPPTIGTTPDTAAAGDHTHTAAEVGAAPADHSHAEYATTTSVNTLSAQVDNRRGVIHSGPGPVPSGTIPGAVVGDYWLNESAMELSKITGL